jgi:hypothetical protein
MQDSLISYFSGMRERISRGELDQKNGIFKYHYGYIKIYAYSPRLSIVNVEPTTPRSEIEKLCNSPKVEISHIALEFYLAVEGDRSVFYRYLPEDKDTFGGTQWRWSSLAINSPAECLAVALKLLERD